MKRRLCLALVLLRAIAYGGEVRLLDLTCDYRFTPLAVDRQDPLLSWRLDGERRGLAQQAYHIQAATSPARLSSPDLWDSAWVEDVRSSAIPYAGKPFGSKQRVYWRVRIKDDQGAVLPWSEATRFDGGLLLESDWQNAQWISCTREFQEEYAPADVMGDWIAAGEAAQPADAITYRFEFSLPEKHVVYAGAWWNHVNEGEIELMVNGRKGLHGTEGPPTVYYKDYSFYLEPDNEVRITLQGADRATPVSFGMKVVFADGTEQIVQTSGDWTVEVGDDAQPVRVVCNYGQAPLGEAMISPRAPLAAAWYKKDVHVTKTVAEARLYLCGLGYSEPYLNGKKIGDHVLDPGQTDYGEFALYQVFEVENYLRDGDNALAILLGDGWYNNDRMFSHARFAYGKPGLRAYLDIRYADGTSETVISGNGWTWKPSGISMSNLFLGDDMDYRQWHSEWEKPGVFNGWKPVEEVKPLSPKLVVQDFPPVRVVREIEPVKTWQVGEKTWIVDLGQNISGWIGLDFHEPAGTVIRLRCTEMLDEAGRYLDNVPGSFWSCHSSPQHHRIIADGNRRRWRPFFSYHGFRYAEVHGLSKAPTAGQIKGLVVHTDVPVTAVFKSVNPLLDRIFKMGIQTHHNNMHSILEDCPHREKCLWGGDLHSSWATGFYTLDSASFYRQQVRLFCTPPFDPKGIPGRIGVGKRSTKKALDFTWSVSPLFLAWQNFQLNEEIQTARDYYEVMRRLLRLTEQDSTDLMPNLHRYGDHASPEGIERTPADSQLIAGLNFYAAAQRFADFAGLFGKADDATWSRELAERIRTSLVKNYYDPAETSFGNGTHDSLALAFGVLDRTEAKGVAASLAKVYRENGKKFDGGFMSYYIYPMLTEFGQVDLALEMLLNPDYPGIAQSIRDYDATTIFERYRNDSRTRQLRHSLDHHAMNHPTAWMLNYLAGIQRHPDEPGFRRLLLQPYIPTDLAWVEAEKKTAYGTVKSAWKQENGRVAWSFTVPANSVAEVRLPDGLKDLRAQGKEVTGSKSSLELAAGSYQLEWSR